MKKIYFIVCLFLLGFFLTVPMKVICVKADASQKAEDELGEIIYEQIDKLDLEALQEYIDSLGDFSTESVEEQLIAYIKGESIDYQNFFSTILEILFSKISEIAPAFACIMAITLVSGLISSLGSSTNGVASSNTIFMIAYASALLPLISVLIECFTQTFSSMREMKKQMELIYPIMLTLMAASGGTLSAAICKPAVAFFSNGIVSIINSVVFPFTIVIIVFSMAGNFSKELKIGSFCDFFKSINKWLLGLCVSVFGLFFTIQGLTASSYDGVVRRAAKYAIGNGVPIVGGFLSGGFDLAIAGSVLIKNSIGNMGIFLMITVVFEPIILLSSITLLLRLTCAVTQLFGDSRISDFLGETANNLRYCTAGVLFTAFLYFLSIVLMISSSEVLF